MNKLASVLVVDEHEVITGALIMLLGSMPEVSECRAVGSLGEARTLLSRHTPDVVLLDINLPDGDGQEFFGELRQALPGCRIMLISGQFKTGQLVQLSRLNADGIFSKTDSLEQLQEALLCVLDGDTYVSAEVSAMLNAAQQDLNLSPRQMQILLLVDAGNTNKDIANRTGLTASTVAFHLRETRLRLGVKTTREAIKLAHATGLL